MGIKKLLKTVRRKIVAAAGAAICIASSVLQGKNGSAPSSLLRKLYGRYLRLDFKEEKHDFGGTRFYQSYAALYIPGSRPTDFRIAEYGVEKYLSLDKDVLDIGCNCGFFDLTISQKVKSVTGLEYDPYYLDYARKAAQFMNITNVRFISGDFKEFQTDERFDIVFSFAVHRWIGLPLKEYFKRIYDLLKPDGIVLFESHGLQKYDGDIDAGVIAAADGLFSSIGDGILRDGFKTPETARKYRYLQKITRNA